MTPAVMEPGNATCPAKVFASVGPNLARTLFTQERLDKIRTHLNEMLSARREQLESVFVRR